MSEQSGGIPAAPMRPVVDPTVRAPRPALGIVLIVVAMSFIPVMDGIAKVLTARLPVLEIVWARYAFHLALFLPFVLWRYGARTFRLQRPLLQILRGGALLVSTFCFFSAVAAMPLADAIAVVFIYPFVVTMLAPVLLGDQVGAWRWGAVIAGFVGAMIIIRPGIGVISEGTIYALGAGLSYALYVLGTRRLAGTDPPLVTVVMTGLVGTVVASLVAPSVWVAPEPADWVALVGLGMLAAIGHLMIIFAYENASAPQLAPFAYVEIVGATLVGWVMFGDFPDAVTWVGISIIVTSGIVIAWREGRQMRRGRPCARRRAVRRAGA